VTPVKCVVWDLDGTVWPDTVLENPSSELPDPDDAALTAMDVLRGRGIVCCVVSRTDPSLLPALRAHPKLGERVLLWELGWGHKSDAIAAIADRLGIGIDAIAFVDDSPFERSEVSAVLPSVLIFTPADFIDQLDGSALRPAQVSGDARERVRRYRDEIGRQDLERGEFEGRREAFLRDSGIILTVRDARAANTERVAELVQRTHRLNSVGDWWQRADVEAVVADPSWWSVTGQLADRHGDYGLIAAAFVHVGSSDSWQVGLLAVSCRVAGRGVPGAMLSVILDHAQAHGVSQIRVDLVPSEANVELRVLLADSGFTAAASSDRVPAAFVRDTSPLQTPDWLKVVGPDRTEVSIALRGMLAALLDQDRADLACLPDTMPLLRDGLALGSIRGAALLARIRDQLGVDVAEEDVSLRSLATIGSLTDFVARRWALQRPAR
jgi:methoxymalonate biosynthesis protein